MSEVKRETCRLYTYWNDYSDTWTMYSVKATVLPKSYKLHERIGAFGYSGMVSKDDPMYRENPEAAYSARVEQLERQVVEASSELQRVTNRLNALKKLARPVPHE